MPLIVIALVAAAGGAAAGYWIARWLVSTQMKLQMDRELLDLKNELGELQQQVETLRQQNADLEYQLGEERKARRYAEQGRGE